MVVVFQLEPAKFKLDGGNEWECSAMVLVIVELFTCFVCRSRERERERERGGGGGG